MSSTLQQRLRSTTHPLILDGSMATELSALGYRLDDRLWSGSIVLEHPDAVIEVHHDYMRAGANIITTAGYQLTLPGLRRRGLSAEKALSALEHPVRLANQARDQFMGRQTGKGRDVWIAASIASYGAYLADGSEYRGRYDINRSDLKDFHMPNIKILAATNADIIAFETMPVFDEIKVIAELMVDYRKPYWISLSSPDGNGLADGTPIETVLRFLEGTDCLLIGLNCCPPAAINDFLALAMKVTNRALMVYPNSGEQWRSSSHDWVGSRANIEAFAEGWRNLRARVIGGCCRIGPADIAKVARALSRPVSMSPDN